MNWKLTFSYSTAVVYFKALFWITLYIGIDILQILWLWQAGPEWNYVFCKFYVCIPLFLSVDRQLKHKK